MTHDGTTIPVTSGIYTVAHFACCETCGWTGPETTRALAIRDLLEHLKETA